MATQHDPYPPGAEGGPANSGANPGGPPGSTPIAAGAPNTGNLGPQSTGPRAPGPAQGGPRGAGQWGGGGRGGYGGYGNGPVPPRPERPRTRIFPIILGLLIVLGGGMLSLLFFISMFIPVGGGAGSGGGLFSSMSLGGHPIAILEINQPIGPGDWFDFWMDSLSKIAGDDEIKGLVLRINSPGGSVASSQELYDEVANLRDKHGKTIYVSMGDVCASGGYYIAAAADRVFANRGTLTGSVGVISTSIQIDEFAKEHGVNVETVKTGRFKDLGSMFRPMNDEDRKAFALLLDDAYGQFIDDILAYREEPLDAARSRLEDADWDHFLFEKPEEAGARAFLLQIADGRVYSGAQAHKLGLVDELGSMHSVIDRLAGDLNVEADTKTFEPRQSRGLLDLIAMKVKESIPDIHGSWALQYRMVGF